MGAQWFRLDTRQVHLGSKKKVPKIVLINPKSNWKGQKSKPLEGYTDHQLSLIPCWWWWSIWEWWYGNNRNHHHNNNNNNSSERNDIDNIMNSINKKINRHQSTHFPAPKVQHHHHHPFWCWGERSRAEQHKKVKKGGFGINTYSWAANPLFRWWWWTCQYSIGGWKLHFDVSLFLGATTRR